MEYSPKYLTSAVQNYRDHDKQRKNEKLTQIRGNTCEYVQCSVLDCIWNAKGTIVENRTTPESSW